MNLIRRANASVQARFVQPYMQKHYSGTKDGKKLAALKGTYAGKRCFFVGNGPSLCAEDLTKLHEHGEVTFAFNRVYNIFDHTPWKPTFYISQDEKMLAGCADVVDQLELENKLVPVQLKWYYNIQIHDAVYFNMNWQQKENPLDFEFSDEIAKEIFCASTGMYTAAQLAAYMGFREIDLIGVDHHFRTSVNNKGEIVIDDKVKDYFTDKYNDDKDKLYIPNTEKSTLTYVAMKRHCDQRGIQVYNATRGGKLEVFPRVEFDSLF